MRSTNRTALGRLLPVAVLWSAVYVYYSVHAEVTSSSTFEADFEATVAGTTTTSKAPSTGGRRQKYGHGEVPGVNCTPPGIDDFPTDLLTPGQRAGGGILIHFAVSMYIFYAIARICDDYFVPSMECICEGLKMPSDVAGATFMAIATSAPELFTNIIGTFITRGDIGIGTIVGSAVFNILAVAAVCGLAAGVVIPLEWWSVSRDCLFYSLSVTLLIIVLRDERIYWYEALVLVLVYGLYILGMYCNSYLKSRAEALVRHFRKKPTSPTYAMAPTEEEEKMKDELLVEEAVRATEAEAEEEKKLYATCRLPQNQPLRVWLEFIIGWPIRLAYKFTVPDCREPKWKRFYPATFLMCILWIGVLSYIVNWMMTIIGHTLKIPDSVMGLTFIAAGTSIPEVVSSLIVSRQGMGTMAISNSIGSNTFDILMCLGLPWLIRSALISSEPVDYIKINSIGLEYASMMLITSLAVLYLILTCNRYVLDRKVGLTALSLYFGFLVVATLFELNVFFVVNLPTCVHFED